MPDEGYVEHPHFTSIKQRTEERKVKERIKANLTETIEDPKAAKGQPSLAYIKDPLNKNATELKEVRRVAMLQDAR